MYGSEVEILILPRPKPREAITNVRAMAVSGLIRK